MASFVENTQHKVERKAFEIMTNSIVGKLTKTDDIAKRQETFLELIDKAETFWGNEMCIRDRLEGVDPPTKEQIDRAKEILGAL